MGANDLKPQSVEGYLMQDVEDLRVQSDGGGVELQDGREPSSHLNLRTRIRTFRYR